MDSALWRRRPGVIAVGGVTGVVARLLLSLSLIGGAWENVLGRYGFNIAVGRLFIGTRLEDIGDEVSLFFFYIPDLVLLSLLGFALAMYCRAFWILMCVTFLLVFAAASVIARELSPWSVVYYGFFSPDRGRGNLAITFAVFLGLIYGAFVAAAWVGCRFRRRQPPTQGECARCAYDLRGLTEPRCPECGNPFADEQARDRRGAT